MRQNTLFRTRICHLHALTCRSDVPNSLFRRAVRSLRSSLALHSLQISSSRTAYAVSFALSAGRFCVVATRFCPSRKLKIFARGPRSHLCNAVRSFRSLLSSHSLQISSSRTACAVYLLGRGALSHSMPDRNNTNRSQSNSFRRFCTAETCQYVYYCLRSARATSSENLLL